MPALVETMFSVRQPVWHGLGTIVKEAPTSEEAIKLAGLDWDVVQEEVFTQDGVKIPDAVANVRSDNGSPLGIVGNRYQVVQNVDAFNFTDALLGEGVKYETAGSLRDGKQIWLLAKLPEPYKILGEDVEPFVVFTNAHDGSSAVKVAMTPIRVVCNNTLNLALKKAKRTWSARHTGNFNQKWEQARKTLELADTYMNTLNETMETAYTVKVNDDKLHKLVDDLIPTSDKATDRQKRNQERIKADIVFRYEEAPDLKKMEKTGARFIQAVADTASHIQPARLTQNYQQNFFAGMINGNGLADKALELVYAAA